MTKYKLLLVECRDGTPDVTRARWNLTFKGLDETVKADDLNAPDPAEVLETLQMVVTGERDALIASYGAEPQNVRAALAELSQFKRSVGQSDEARDALFIAIVIKLNRWNAELNTKGALSAKSLTELTTTLKSARAMGLE